MFQRLLLVWPPGPAPARALALARSVATAYDAELVIGLLRGGDGDAAAPHGEAVEAIAGADAASVLDHANAHGFDLVVAGGRGHGDRLALDLVRAASVPTLVVSE